MAVISVVCKERPADSSRYRDDPPWADTVLRYEIEVQAARSGTYHFLSPPAARMHYEDPPGGGRASTRRDGPMPVDMRPTYRWRR